MRNKMKKWSLSIIFLSSTIALAAVTNDATEDLLNSVHYDSTGNVPVVDLDAMKKALEDGANPNYVDTSKAKFSVLKHISLFCVHDASDDPELARSLLEAFHMLFDHGARLQKEDATILFFPIAGGHTEIVHLLLEKGASPTLWPPEIGTPLTPVEYASKEGYVDIVALLVEKGAKPLPPEQVVQVRFVEVAGQRNIGELQNLLKMGARINGKNQEEETALLSAIGSFSGRTYEDYLTVLWLLQNGADLNLPGKGRFNVTTPLHDLVWVASLVEQQTDRWAKAEQLLLLFFKKGAFVSGLDDRERTPLHIAAENNGVETARILLKVGAKVMPRDKNKKTPLDYAQSAEMIKILKESGAKE